MNPLMLMVICLFALTLSVAYSEYSTRNLERKKEATLAKIVEERTSKLPDPCKTENKAVRLDQLRLDVSIERFNQCVIEKLEKNEPEDE